jgi:CubicO group peptidase (beta-lactamase class C family)
MAALACLGVSACDSDASAGRAAADGDSPGTRNAAASTRGLDSALLAQAFDSAATMPRLRSLLVARHGETVREAYFNGATADARANIKSASKSIIWALVGIAIEEGKLDGTSQKIAPFFPADAGANPDPRLQAITIGNLLSMQSGLEPTSFGNYGEWVSSGNWVRYALTRPFVDDPGGRMLYSTGSTHLLSAIITKATGMSTLAYARSRLFRPMGIELTAWSTDPQGIYFGGNEMRLRPRELMKFAELYRNGGALDGRQVIPAAWVDSSRVRRTSSPFNGHGYGYGWWQRYGRNHQVFFAWGYGGQYAFVVPDLELTVVTTSDAVSPREGDHNGAIHGLLTQLLIPAAEKGGRAAGD